MMPPLAARRRLLLSALLLLVPSLACHWDGVAGESGTFEPGTAQHVITVGDLGRRFVLHVPAKRPMTSAGVVRGFGLVIVLHGSSGSAEDMEVTTGLDSISEEGRFLVAYGQGVQGAGGLFPSDWNAGQCCGAAARENIDDVGYVTAIIAAVAKDLALDKQRIYVAGFSDGGRMAHHIGCQLSTTVAAIAVVSGSIEDDDCHPAKPVAMIAIHGTSDDQVDYYQPTLTAPPSVVPGTDTLPPAIQFWAATNGCKTFTQTHPATDVTRTGFASCTNDVVFYSIAGGVHAWPGDPGGAGSQPPMSELKASRVIWGFFSRQLRK